MTRDRAGVHGDRRESARACTRAPRRSSCTWHALPGARPRRARRPRDGRQEHHGHAAARRGAGIDDHASPPTAPTRRTRVDGARRRWSQSGFGEDVMQRLNGHRRLARRRRRPRRRPDPARAGAALSACAGRARRARARAARREPRARRASSSSTSRRASRSRPAPELASLFDAQLLMLDDPMLVAARRRHRPRAARERRVGGAAGVRGDSARVFDEVADPYLRERKGDVADLVGRLRMNLRERRRDAARSAARARRGVGAHRRRADAVARGAGRLDQRFAASPPTPAAGRTTPRSSRGRSKCRRSSACTTRAR